MKKEKIDYKGRLFGAGVWIALLYVYWALAMIITAALIWKLTHLEMPMSNSFLYAALIGTFVLLYLTLRFFPKYINKTKKAAKETYNKI